MVGQVGLYWLGSIALVLLFGSLVVALPRYRAGQDSLEAIIGFSFAFAAFGAFTMSSLGYTITTNAGVVLRESSQMLTIFGLLGTVVAFLLLIDAAMKALAKNAP